MSENFQPPFAANMSRARSNMKPVHAPAAIPETMSWKLLAPAAGISESPIRKSPAALIRQLGNVTVGIPIWNFKPNPA